MEKLKDWLERLACPVCKAKLELQEQQLFCNACNNGYSIVEGIPIMLENNGQNKNIAENE